MVGTPVPSHPFVVVALLLVPVVPVFPLQLQATKSVGSVKISLGFLPVISNNCQS